MSKSGFSVPEEPLFFDKAENERNRLEMTEMT